MTTDESAPPVQPAAGQPNTAPLPPPRPVTTALVVTLNVVQFYGDKLEAVRDENGTVWVSINVSVKASV